MTQTILTDIEGTTSSLAFVKDVLFPYARTHIADFIRQHAYDAAVQAELQAVRAHLGAALDDDQLIAQLIQWIDADQKITPLKALQGMIWARGYQQGHFVSHVYADAVKRLRQWHLQGLRLCVYSSGSVAAQKLLFAHTAFGDLTPLFSGYFDTTVGAKREADSYQRIAEALATPAGDILFLSDIEAELDAARAVGMQTCWLVRDAPLDAQARHRQVADFDAITW